VIGVDSIPIRKLEKVHNSAMASAMTILAQRMRWVKWEQAGLIGSGKFGRVYPGMRLEKSDTAGGTKWPAAPVAVKVIDPPNDLADQRRLMSEIEIMARVSHPALLSLFAWDVAEVPPGGPQKYIVVTRRLKCGLDRILQEKPEEWNDTAKSLCMLGIAAGVLYLHSMNAQVLHRDLKPENVLVDNDLKPVVCDFGFSKIIDPEKALGTTMTLGTPLYMAPELHAGQVGAAYTTKIDVYAYAFIVYWIVTGRIAFYEQKDMTAAKCSALVTAGKRPNLAVVPERWKPLLERGWAHDPDDRPTFAEIVQNAEDLKLEGCDEQKWATYKQQVTAFLKPK
jgi:serine/threonine protein kinase